MRKLSLLPALALALVMALPQTAAGEKTQGEQALSWTFFGVTFCTEKAPAEQTCHVRVPARTETPQASQPRVLKLFGTTFCFGEKADGHACDVRIPVKHDQQASLNRRHR